MAHEGRTKATLVKGGVMKTDKKPSKKRTPKKTKMPKPMPTIVPDWAKHHGHDRPTFGCTKCAELNRGMWVCVCLCPNPAIMKTCKACKGERSAAVRLCTCEHQRKSHKQMEGACKSCGCLQFEPASKKGGAR